MATMRIRKSGLLPGEQLQCGHETDNQHDFLLWWY